MKRRKFLQYTALGSIGCGVSLQGYSLADSQPSSASKKSHHNWVVLYWMPYDNDLSRFGEPILEMLAEATQSKDTAVVVQADFWRAPHMYRYEIINGQTTQSDLNGQEDSSDVSEFAKYLDWSQTRFAANHWAIIVVGHGGKLDEISPDKHSETLPDMSWMKIDEFAQAINRFNTRLGQQIDLLFFQNCNKATVEVIYETRHCSQYTLASQFLLGAPNYYYQGFLEALQNKSVRGREAALSIMDSEEKSMYNTLTLVNNQAVQQIPQYLVPLIELLKDHRLSKIPLKQLPIYRYFSEPYCDILLLLNYLSQELQVGGTELNEFSTFITSAVISHYEKRGMMAEWRPTNISRRQTENTLFSKFCGLSIYLPIKREDIAGYGHFDLYEDVRLMEFYQILLSASN